MEIAIYARVSTQRQQHQQTIEQQLERLRAHIAQQPDWRLAPENVLRDDGHSGAKMSRPGLDRLRDRIAMASFSLVLITAPDRLARNYVHQVLLIEELKKYGCRVEFLDRPMTDDPHDQLVLQIRGAVAEYERSLIGDRMRRGRLARLRGGQLLPWTVPPYGFLTDAERPRDPNRVRLDPVASVIVGQIFTWYTESEPPLTLYKIARRLTEAAVLTPMGRERWNVATIRGILRNPAYAGTAYSDRRHVQPAQTRRSALKPIGSGPSSRPAPQEDWIGVSVPAIITQEMFAAAQERLEHNKQMASRHNTKHQYLLRGLVSCGRCLLSFTARCAHPGYSYYVCRDRSDMHRAAAVDRCQARYAPAAALDELVWKDLCQLLTEPSLITGALQRARGGEWLPQAQRQNITRALKRLEKQQAQLLDLHLAEIIDRAEFERKRQELAQTHSGLTQQFKELEAQAQKQLDTAALAAGIEMYCQRLQPTLDQLPFARRRQLVELLIDRVIVNDGKVEVRYVIPTGPAGEKNRFCHLRKDYFAVEPKAIFTGRPLGSQGNVADQMPNAPLAFLVASAADRDPKLARRRLAIIQPPEAAPSFVAVEPQAIELDPFSLIVDFRRAFDPNDVFDLQLVQQLEKTIVWKPAIGREPNPGRLDGSKDQRERALDDGEFVAPHPSLESGLLIGSPVDWHRPAPDDQGEDEQMLVILDRPIDRESDLACARQLFKRFPAKPFGEIFGIEALIMDQPRQALRGGLLISLRTGEFGLIACLFFKDCRDKGRDGFDLMGVCPGQQISDVVFNACRSGLCCHSTNRISQVVTCADTHIYRKCPDISYPRGISTRFWTTPLKNKKAQLLQSYSVCGQVRKGWTLGRGML